MDAERLSAITWDVECQRAWMLAYRDARRIHAARPYPVRVMREVTMRLMAEGAEPVVEVRPLSTTTR